MRPRQVSLAAGRVRIRPWTVQVASRGLTDRDADCPAGYLGLVVAGSRGRARSSWAREVMSSLAKTLPRWYFTVRTLMYNRLPISWFDRPSRASRAS
jgi:hypothetical protein